MAMPQMVKKNYGERLTLDLDSPLPKITEAGALSLKNVIRRAGKDFSKRPGVVLANAREVEQSSLGQTGSDGKIFGLHNYSYADSNSDLNQSLMTLRGPALIDAVALASHVLAIPITKSTLTVQYAGVGTCTLSILSNGAAWSVALKKAGVAVAGWPKTFGTAFSALAGNTISDLVTALNLVAGITATASATNTANTLVANLGSVVEVDIKTTALVVSYDNATIVDTEALRISAADPDIYGDYRNLKGVNVANIMLFPAGKNLSGNLKWDGQTLCEMGLPQATISSIADTGAGAALEAAGEYVYRVVYKRVDKPGNIIYGPYSDDTLTVADHTVGGAPTNVTVTFDTLFIVAAAKTRWAPRSALVNGAQVGVTAITVNAGHNVLVGDVLSFYDSTTRACYTRTVTISAALAITVDLAVTVANNDIISNLRAEIYRTQNGVLTDFFLVAEVPMTALATTQAFVDSVTDANIGADMEEQNKSLFVARPPPCSYMCIHQGLVVMACSQDDPNGLYWNDLDWGYEAFPRSTNQTRIQGARAEGITGIISENDTTLAVFKDKSYFRIIGDLAANQYIITEVSQGDLGVPSHASLVKIADMIVGISQRGPVTIKDGRIALAASGVKSSFYNNEYFLADAVTIPTADQSKLVPKRATGTYWAARGCIVFFIPAESGANNGNDRYANANSLWLCYDTEADEWREWNFANYQMNAHVAMEVFNDELYFVSLDTNTGSPGVRSRLWRMRKDDDISTFVDDISPINWVMRLSWETLGSPSSFKTPSEMKLYSLDEALFLASFTLTIKDYRDYKSTVRTNTTRTFSDANDKEKVIRPALGKFRSQSIEISNNVAYECPFLSGIETSYRVTDEERIRDKRGD